MSSLEPLKSIPLATIQPVPSAQLKTDQMEIQPPEEAEASLSDTPDQWGDDDTLEFFPDLSNADTESVVNAQAQDVLTEAEEQRITEAFQADLNMTDLLEIIRGADMSELTQDAD